MHLIYSVLLALLIAATPQARNLSSLLSSHENLSSLNSVVSANPELVQALDSAKDVTVLAPSNAAIDRLRNETNSTTLESQFNDPAFARALLQYHVLNGEYAERNIGEIGMFIPTLLTDDAYVNITGGQVVQAIRTPNSAAGSNSDSSPGKTVFYSGYNKNSTVIEPDIRFDGGLVHVVDSVLVIPANVTATSIAAGLTSHVGAVEDADFKWDEWSNSTFFVPNNQGFQVVGSVLMDMNPEELHTILMYHVINDTTPIYTPEIDHADWITTTDTNVTFNFTADSTIFVNSAAIVQANILVANGVIHIIDNVLNPNATSIAVPSGPSGVPAFEDTSGNEPPFTSGVPTATTTVASGPTATMRNGGAQDPESDAALIGIKKINLLICLIVISIVIV